MKIYPIRAAIFFAFLCFVPAKPTVAAEINTSTYSLEDVLVLPKRIVFEGDNRKEELSLLNRSDKTLSYAISFVQYRMTETGRINEISEPATDEHFADPYIRFTPNRIVLEPRETQSVRLQLRKPAALAEGEYRSHLVFRVIPDVVEATGKQNTASKGISIKISPIYGLSIPVIVRQGILNATVRMTGLHLVAKDDAGRPALVLTVEREGKKSVFGDFEVEWKASGSKTVTIGQMTSIAVYTPNTKRIMTIPLTLPKGLQLQGGTLSVRYVDASSSDKQLLSESTLEIP